MFKRAIIHLNSTIIILKVQKLAILNSYTDSIGYVKKTHKIDSTSKNDLDVELLKEGVLTLEQFLKRTKSTKGRKNYLISEMEEIDAFYLEKLSNAGIYTTGDLLDECSNEIETVNFAQQNGINLELLRNWKKSAKKKKI